MAPPPNRRPGFSRRAQYGLFFGYVVAVAGVLFALLLLIVAMIDPRGFSALRGAALDATTPVSSAGRGVVRAVTGTGESIGNYFRAASQNAELKRQLDEAHQQVVEARAVAFENQRLKRLLKLTRESGDRVAVVRVVSSSFESGRRLATIDAGAASGIRPSQPVRAPEGLIGRVIETGRWAARVLLVTDGDSNVPVRLARDGTPAIASGRGDGTMEIKPLEIGNVEFRRGDIFVTSGTGGIYPPNVPVGIVFRATQDETVARPLADPARIDFALVQQVYMPAANAPIEPVARPLPAAPANAAPPPPTASAAAAPGATP